MSNNSAFAGAGAGTGAGTTTGTTTGTAAPPGGAKKQISLADWERRLAQVPISKTDLNKLIMNYLVIEGYKDAAEKFSRETGLAPGVDLASIEDRMRIRKAVLAGNVQEAMERVNDLNPEILDTNPALFFHLQQQRLIELIRNGQLVEAVRFAQDELAPRGEENAAFLGELERTLALLAFDDPQDSPVGDLLSPLQRQKIASELNAAVLASQSQERDPKLPALIKMVVWAQSQLEERVSFPAIRDFGSAQLVSGDSGR